MSHGGICPWLSVQRLQAGSPAPALGVLRLLCGRSAYSALLATGRGSGVHWWLTTGPRNFCQRICWNYREVAEQIDFNSGSDGPSMGWGLSPKQTLQEIKLSKTIAAELRDTFQNPEACLKCSSFRTFSAVWGKKQPSPTLQFVCELKWVWVGNLSLEWQRVVPNISPPCVYTYLYFVSEMSGNSLCTSCCAWQYTKIHVMNIIDHFAYLSLLCFFF